MTQWNVNRRLLFSLAMLACGLSTAGAQDETAAEPLVQKVIRLEHISAPQAEAVIMPLRREASWSVVPELKLISVQGPQGAVEAIERLLQEVDVPGPEDATSIRLNVVFTGYLVGASDAGESQIPEQVRDAVVELGKHFPYKNYSLLETFGIRTQVGGSAEVSGVTTTAPDQPAMRYEVEIQVGDVSETETRKVVRIRALRSQWRLPIETKPDVFVYEEPGLRASLDIPEDVIVVVGKSGSVGAYQGIFLLLKAEVVEP